MFQTRPPIAIMISILIYGLAVLAGFSSPIAAQNCQAAPAQRFQTQMASGFTSKVLLSGLKAPRGMVFDTAGNLLVVEQGGGGVRLVTLAESGGSVCVTASKQIVADSSVKTNLEAVLGAYPDIKSSLTMESTSRPTGRRSSSPACPPSTHTLTMPRRARRRTRRL